MATFTGTPDHVADLILNGVKESFKANIEEKLKDMILPMIKSVAEDYAKQIAINVESYKNYQDGKIEVNVMFNNIAIAKQNVADPMYPR